jgi:hypothetical protein
MPTGVIFVIIVNILKYVQTVLVERKNFSVMEEDGT